MQTQDWEYWAMIAAGLFSIAGGLLDWNFFMENHKAQTMVRILGRNGARGFYVALGLLIVGIGAGMMFGYIPSGRGG